MAYYEYGFQSVAAAAAGNYFDIAAASTDDIVLRELHLFTNAATASAMELFRTTAIGTRTTPITPTALECALLGVGTNPVASFATAWSVAATKAAHAMRWFNTAASIGAGIIWTWYGPAGGLRIPASGSLILNNPGAGAGSVLNVTAVWEE